MKEPHKLREVIADKVLKFRLAKSSDNMDSFSVSEDIISTILKAVNEQVIGEDEHYNAYIIHKAITRNKLRASQRQALKEMQG